MNNEQIKDIALANGFTVKDGLDDLKPYVYDFARALIPSKIYELVYDYGDGYFTLFMTLDKKKALDFIESVRSCDKDFNNRYGRFEDLDEGIFDTYNETHPLNPYKQKVLNHTYEDSLGEWANEYVGETHATSMSVIKHDLYSKQTNQRGSNAANLTKREML